MNHLDECHTNIVQALRNVIEAADAGLIPARASLGEAETALAKARSEVELLAEARDNALRSLDRLGLRDGVNSGDAEIAPPETQPPVPAALDATWLSDPDRKRLPKGWAEKAVLFVVGNASQPLTKEEISSTVSDAFPGVSIPDGTLRSILGDLTKTGTLVKEGAAYLFQT